MGSNSALNMSKAGALSGNSPAVQVNKIKDTLDSMVITMNTLKRDNDVLQEQVCKYTVYKKIVERIDKKFNKCLESLADRNSFATNLTENLTKQKARQGNLRNDIGSRIEINLEWLCLTFFCSFRGFDDLFFL